MKDNKIGAKGAISLSKALAINKVIYNFFLIFTLWTISLFFNSQSLRSTFRIMIFVKKERIILVRHWRSVKWNNIFSEYLSHPKHVHVIIDNYRNQTWLKRYQYKRSILSEWGVEDQSSKMEYIRYLNRSSTSSFYNRHSQRFF